MMTRDDDAKMRVIAEYEQLVARFDALTFYRLNGFAGLDEDSKKLLEKQYWIMKDYKNVLRQRLDNWKDRYQFIKREV